MNARRIAFDARIAMALTLLVFIAGYALAQDKAVSDNAVNAIAETMYCPVCENIPLDECQTLACIEWKDEIRAQLEAGVDEEAIVSSFVQRFGEGVVGLPQDPLLRAMTLLAPFVAALIICALGIATFRRFARNEGQPSDERSTPGATEADYRRRLEADLRSLR